MAAQREHWAEVAPPPYISLAALIGFKGKPRARATGPEFLQGEDLLNYLRAFPGGAPMNPAA